MLSFFFFFNDTATTEIYTLSLHDALPISLRVDGVVQHAHPECGNGVTWALELRRGNSRQRLAAGTSQGAKDRKSTRLNSSHLVISYAVFCLKKKKNTTTRMTSARQAAANS